MFLNHSKLVTIFSILFLVVFSSGCSEPNLPDHYGVFLDTKEGRKELTQSGVSSWDGKIKKPITVSTKDDSLSIVIYLPDRQGSSFWLAKLSSNRVSSTQPDKSAIATTTTPGDEGVILLTPRAPLPTTGDYAIIYTGGAITADAWAFSLEE